MHYAIFILWHCLEKITTQDCENNLLNSCHGETDTSDRWKMQVVLVQTDDSDV